jgi:glycosyltransferase involved in cell wall biosynthesis
VRVRVGASLGAWFPLLYRPLPNKNFLDSYDTLVANSEFTQGWIRRWWGREATVLYPPVTLHDPGEKAKVILGVGRFFAPKAGHSKKQLEMVEAFRRLVERGRAEGWSLHLVGGCSEADRPYLDQVLAAAAGLPVEVHVDASGAELADLYARASIFWHAAGLDEDVEDDPNRQEHFGISIVEAMSAGAVPVVVGQAGPAEIVQPGQSGRHFTDLDDLVRQTEELVADPEELARLSAAAAVRAQWFGLEAFAERLEAIVARTIGR